MKRWYCKSGETVLGPFDFDELKFLKSRGRLAADHLVRDGENGPWLPAGEMRTIFPHERTPSSSARPVSPARRMARTSKPAPPAIESLSEASRQSEGDSRWVIALAILAAAALVALLVAILLWMRDDPEESSRGTKLAAASGRGGGKSDAGNDTAASARKGRADSGTKSGARTVLKKTAGSEAAASPKQTRVSTKPSLGMRSVSGGNLRTISGSRFFGHQAKGNRFVYVVDCSGSMQGDRFKKARHELLRSVHNLEEKQSFFVYFFSTASYPMFWPNSTTSGLLPASRKNIRGVTKWIEEFTVKDGTEPQASLLSALAKKPNGIFFLTDGGFDPGVADVVRRANTGRIPIYTIGFQTRLGATQLKRIAAESGGKYRFVP